MSRDKSVSSDSSTKELILDLVVGSSSEGGVSCNIINHVCAKEQWTISVQVEQSELKGFKKAQTLAQQILMNETRDQH